METIQVKQPGHWHRRERNRKFLYEFLSSSACMDCGEDEIACLQIDHQRDKRYEMRDMVKNRVSIKTIEAELDKCHVVCANCHMRRTAKTQDWYRRL